MLAVFPSSPVKVRLLSGKMKGKGKHEMQSHRLTLKQKSNLGFRS